MSKTSKRSKRLRQELQRTGGIVLPVMYSIPIVPISIVNIRNIIQYDHTKTDSGVYVISANEYYKIGVSKNIKARFNDLQIANPHPLILEHIIHAENYVEVEGALHNLFLSKKVRGEWFMLNEDDLFNITTL